MSIAPHPTFPKGALVHRVAKGKPVNILLGTGAKKRSNRLDS